MRTGAVAGAADVAIDSSGNVGINVPVPGTNQLAVKGTSAYGSGVRIFSDDSATNWARLDLKNENAGSTFVMYQDQTGACGIRNDALAAGGSSSLTLTAGGDIDGTMRFETKTSDEAMRIDASGNLLVGRTSTSAAATDYGTQLYSTGVIYQYSVVTDASDIHRWYNGSGTLVATINGDGEGYFAGGATYSGTLKADEIIQDGAPVVDSLQIIRAFMKLRAATADPDSTVEELREKLKTAVDDIIDQFQDQIDNMPTPLED
jgi:hypothetical protein